MKLFKIVNEWDSCWLVLSESHKDAHEEWQADHNPYDNEGDQYCISVCRLWTVKEATYFVENATLGEGVEAFIEEMRVAEKAKEEKMVEEYKGGVRDDDIPF